MDICVAELRLPYYESLTPPLNLNSIQLIQDIKTHTRLPGSHNNDIKLSQDIVPPVFI
jgi:hypothetical protein